MLRFFISTRVTCRSFYFIKLSLVRRYAPDVYGLPGAALCLEDYVLHQDEHLIRLYRANKRATAYLDESFNLDEDTGQRFYILGCATVKCGWRTETREEIQKKFPDESIHAAPMWRDKRYSDLKKAANLVADEQDGLDIVICSPLAANDARGNQARLDCMRFLLPLVHKNNQVDLFVFDKPNLVDIISRDKRLFRDLIKEGLLSQSAAIHHAYPAHEPLLGLPDILAWSYRQTVTRQRDDWFNYFENQVSIYELPK